MPERKRIKPSSSHCRSLTPFAEAIKGLASIGSAAIFAKDCLQRCARAEGVCVVARSEDWLPRGQEEVHGSTVEGVKPADGNFKAHVVVKPFEGKAIINLGASQINGQFLLPTGYHLFIARMLTRRIGT